MNNKRVPPSVAQFAVGERAELLARIAEQAREIERLTQERDSQQRTCIRAMEELAALKAQPRGVVPPTKAQGVVMQATAGGRNPRYEGLFDGETEEHRAFRLNASPVQQVSVPDGWRVERGYSPSGYVLHSPSGSMIRVCDSGGGGIETAFALFLKAMLTAATAAPAADAGIVDMYRHLQNVTPYRFKKIQDASITDGGDVMYFHKDRFDAALLADMAAMSAGKEGE